jgi:hypothetical protein
MAEMQRCADGVAWLDTLAELALSTAQFVCWRGEADKAHEPLATVWRMLGNPAVGDSFRAKTQNRLWCCVQANSSPISAGSMAMGAGR